MSETFGPISAKLRSIDFGKGNRGVSFWCPGCEEMHGVPITGPRAWGFDGNLTAPSFTPSIKVDGIKKLTDHEWARVNAGEYVTTKPYTCHSIITAGRIMFCSDSTHALAGETVDMPDLPARLA